VAVSNNGAPQGRVGRIFFGVEGLRAGWSLAIYYLLAAAAVVAYALFAPQNDAAGAETATSTILSVGPTAVALVLLALTMTLIEGRSFADYGLRRTHAAADFALGLLCGLVMLFLLVGVLWSMGGLVFGPATAPGVVGTGAAWLFAFLLLGFVEEFWFRGFFQLTLARGLTGLLRWLRPGLVQARAVGFWLAATVFSGLFFVLAHVGNKGETPLGIVSVALAGFVFAFGLYRSGALWWPIGFHVAWDWGETFVFGANNSGYIARDHLFTARPQGPVLLSGGSAGPEGSILIVPVLLLTALLIHRLYRRRTSLGAGAPSRN